MIMIMDVDITDQKSTFSPGVFTGLLMDLHIKFRI